MRAWLNASMTACSRNAWPKKSAKAISCLHFITTWWCRALQFTNVITSLASWCSSRLSLASLSIHSPTSRLLSLLTMMWAGKAKNPSSLGPMARTTSLTCTLSSKKTSQRKTTHSLVSCYQSMWKQSPQTTLIIQSSLHRQIAASRKEKSAGVAIPSPNVTSDRAATPPSISTSTVCQVPHGAIASPHLWTLSRMANTNRKSF